MERIHAIRVRLLLNGEYTGEGEKVMSMKMKVMVGILILLLAGVVSVAQASPPTAASGTSTQTQITSFEIRSAGPNVIIEQTTLGSVSGTLTGNFEDSFRVVIHPNGRFNAQGTITCQCTVEDKSGVLELRLVDSGEIVSPDTAIFAGTAVITGGTGELSDLRGVFAVEGMVDIPSGLAVFTYSGQIHFHP
jgi:ABC-type transport system substrate-binding protein